MGLSFHPVSVFSSSSRRMQSHAAFLSSEPPRQPAVLVLATGGTIAGLAADPAQASRYDAAQLGVRQLIEAVPALGATPLQAEQVAQLDSKNMGTAVWAALTRRIETALRDETVGGIVVTHGTDTLEETARLLARLFDTAHKPVVMTAAMRPANAPDADGPQNLADAVTVAQSGVPGVSVVLQRQVWAAAQVRKLHTRAIDAFGSADALPWGSLDEAGGLRWATARPAPPAPATGLDPAHLPATGWPRVEIVTSHAEADGRVVMLLVDDGVEGLVVAGTGNGTVHAGLEAALHRAVAHGVRVVVGSRVGRGAVCSRGPWPCSGELTPAQARVDLMLDLLQARSAPRA